MDKRLFLKIKLKSLAEEARIIKREERRRKVFHPRFFGHENQEYREAQKKDRAADAIRRAGRRSRPWYPMSAQELHELTRHRLDVVRRVARLTNIAYAWIRGRDISIVDSLKDLKLADLQAICGMVQRYGDPTNLLCMYGAHGRMNVEGSHSSTYLAKVEFFKLGASEKKTVFPYARYTVYSDEQDQVRFDRAICEHANAAAVAVHSQHVVWPRDFSVIQGHGAHADHPGN